MKKIIPLVLFAILALAVVVSSASALTVLPMFAADNGLEQTIDDGDSTEMFANIIASPDAVDVSLKVDLYEFEADNYYFVGRLYEESFGNIMFYTTDTLLLTPETYPGPGLYIIEFWGTECYTDSDCSDDTEILTLTVTGEEVIINHDPTIQSINDVVMNENAQRNVQAIVDDQDGDVLTCSLTQAPAWVSINANTCAISINAPEVSSNADFDVEVKVSDNHGGSAKTSFKITVVDTTDYNQAPSAAFTYSPSNPRTIDTVSFDASASSDADGSIVQYAWDFDSDGTIDAYGITTTHLFDVADTYLVTLKVTDDDGVSDSTSQQLTVTQPILVLDYISCNPDVVQGHHQLCSASVHDERSAIVEGAAVSFYYADGSTMGACTTNFKGLCNIDPIITLDAGLQTVYAKATKPAYIDSEIAEDTFRVWTERYLIQGLEIFSDDDFSEPERSFYRSEPVYAEFVIYDELSQEYMCETDLLNQVFLRINNADPLHFSEWQELDHIEVVEPNIFDHVKSLITGEDPICSYRYWLPSIPLTDDYLGQGRVFAFTFNFSDNTAGQNSKVVTVLNNEVGINLKDAYTIVKETPSSQGNVVVDLKALVVDVETLADDMIYSASIDQADFTTSIANGVLTITSLANSAETATLTVVVDDTDGSTDSDAAQIVVEINHYPQAPVANAGRDMTVYAGQVFTLDASASYDPDGGDIVLYDWSVADASSNAAIEYSYAEIGTYSISLMVTDDEGDTDSDEVVITVVEEELSLPPVAVAGSDLTVYVNDDFTLDASASYDPDGGDILFYLWDLNSDGLNDGHGVSLSAHYTEIGVYTVTLTVTDDESDTATDTLTITVIEKEPEPTSLYPMCDLNGDGKRDLSDVVVLAQCKNNFDINGDDIHNLQDVQLLASYVYSDSDPACYQNFVCLPDPYVPACSDGLDNDHDGLIDMDDPGCGSPKETSEFNYGGSGAESGLKILSISTYTNQGYELALPGDTVTVKVVLDNYAGEDLEDLRITFKVPELGIKQKSSLFDLDEDDRETKYLQVYLPEDAWPYEYYTEISVSNDDLRRSTHRMLEVIEG